MTATCFYRIEGREKDTIVEATRRTIASARILARHWRRSGVDDIVIRHPDGRAQSVHTATISIENARSNGQSASYDSHAPEFSEMGAYRFHYFDSTHQETMCFVRAACDEEAIAFAKTHQHGLALEVREAARLVVRLPPATFQVPDALF